MRREQLTNQIDWLTVLLYLILIVAGWLSIYAADFDLDTSQSLFSMKQSSGKQLLWMGTSIFLILVIFVLDYRFFDSFAYIIYAVVIILLLAVLVFGKEVAGNRAWLEIGSFRLQPSEFAKVATALALARYFSSPLVKSNEIKTMLYGSVIVFIPILMVLLQKDAGTAMVFFAFILVFFREGMSPLLLLLLFLAVLLFLLTLLINNNMLIIGIIILGLLFAGVYARTWQRGLVILAGAVMAIGLVVSVDFVLNDVLRDHQRKRVMLLVNPNADPLGVGWNTTQSKIAIGSGGFSGKGFLEGTQTKFDFVPEQTTDFIFCTIGEEQGWIGSTLLLVAFTLLLLRIIAIAERQKSTFVRVYGYAVVAIIFFHFSINIAMTIGLFPVIGIPLPFFSYGGSSLWSFTILLFILLKLDAHRMEMLQRF